jgi:hypothetical protein
MGQALYSGSFLFGGLCQYVCAYVVLAFARSGVGNSKLVRAALGVVTHSSGTLNYGQIRFAHGLCDVSRRAAAEDILGVVSLGSLGAIDQNGLVLRLEALPFALRDFRVSVLRCGGLVVVLAGPLSHCLRSS